MNDIKKILFLKLRRLLPAIVILQLVFWLGPIDTILAGNFDQLLGRWQRADGGYIIEVRHIQPNGDMEAGYYNPRPINVARAHASMHGDTIKIELELRDRGYPGSAYTLIYAADKDALFGYYYHAPSRQNIDVVFVRMK